MSKNLIASRLTEISLNKNIPLIGTLELTYGCPLKCLHCYLPQTQGRASVLKKKELSTEDWKRVLRQLKKAGCLYIVFTGGEPLLRKDFVELCQYAATLNFSVQIFSTGYNVTKELIGKLKDCSVMSFEMSFYGRKHIHNKITGDKNSFDRTLKAAKLIRKSGMTVKFKAPLMRENFSEMSYIRDICKKSGFSYSFDPILAPANDGNKQALKYRITESQIKTLLKDPDLDFLSDCTQESRDKQGDFFCGAGKNVFGINPYGEVYPCLQLPVVIGNLAKKSFAEIWKKSAWLKKWRNLSVRDLKECPDCKILSFCNRCPGLALVEDGDLMGPSRIACDIAKMRYSLLK